MREAEEREPGSSLGSQISLGSLRFLLLKIRVNPCPSVVNSLRPVTEIFAPWMQRIERATDGHRWTRIESELTNVA